MSNLKSYLDERLYGVCYVSGLWGVGKTTFATTAERPELTAMVDFDLKFKQEANRLGFWYAYPQSDGKSALDFDVAKLTEWLRDTLRDIPGQMTTVVFDNATGLEDLLKHIVSQNPAKYGVNPANAAAGRYGGVNPGVGKLWKQIVTFLQNRGVRVIFIVAHLGQPWIDGKPVPNKFRGKGNKTLQELANLSIILTRDKSQVPAGLVVKEQFAQRTFDKGIWTIQRVFPSRFPQADWPHILEYFDKPADFASPDEGETWSRKELDMYGDLLTDAQMEFIKAVAGGEYLDDGDLAPQSVGEAGPEQSQPTNNSNGTKATVGTRQWKERADELAERVPYYQSNGKPNYLHMVQAAAKIGFEAITDDNLDSVIDKLEAHANAAANAEAA